MNIDLLREEFTDKTTIGKILIDGEFECYSLEDVVRQPDPTIWLPEYKIAGRTAIPYGTFEVTITFSKRFNRALPLLLAVPDFEGVRIHAGNTESDTDGCICAGKAKGKDFIGESVVACSLLFLQIERAIQSEKVFIDIRKAA